MENRFNLSISSRVRPSGFIPGKPLLWLPHGFILNLNTFKRNPQKWLLYHRETESGEMRCVTRCVNDRSILHGRIQSPGFLLQRASRCCKQSHMASQEHLKSDAKSPTFDHASVWWLTAALDCGERASPLRDKSLFWSDCAELRAIRSSCSKT